MQDNPTDANRLVYDDVLFHHESGGVKEYDLRPSSVFELFKMSNSIKIPDYQRPYSWGKENVNSLLNDINKLSHEDRGSWFLGPVFMVKRIGSDELILLDGQQRITTIQIILREAMLLEHELDSPLDLSSYPEVEERYNDIKDSVKTCQYNDNRGNKIPIFKPEDLLINDFNYYLNEFRTIRNQTDLKDKREKLYSKLDKAAEDGSPTAKTFKESIILIQKFLEKEFLNKNTNNIENFKNLNSYLSALLFDCWIINIPLNKNKESIKIFESINNRGKGLSLVDKLRYKTLIKCSDASIDKIRKKWKEIYVLLNSIEKSGFIKDEDDFFKVFFNSIDGENRTKHTKFLEKFELLFLANDEAIIKFLEEVIVLSNFCNYIKKALDSTNDFIDKFKTSDKNKVKALIMLLDSALSQSDNLRFLLFYIVRKYNTVEYNLVLGIWNIIRIYFYTEIYINEKSNEIRTQYLRYISSDSNGGEVSQLFLKDDIVKSFKFNESYKNLIITKDNGEAYFVIMLHSYLNNYEDITQYNITEYNSLELDHLFPIKYLEHWKDKLYKTEDVISHLDSLKNKEHSFKNINFNLLRSEIENNVAFELNSKTDKDRSLVNQTLIQFIGNKWLLRKYDNNSSSNFGFDIKKRYYENEKIQIPSKRSKNGMGGYNSFSYKEIIERSLSICDNIINNYYNNWFENKK